MVTITKAAIARGRRFEPKWVQWLRTVGRTAEKVPKAGMKDESDTVSPFQGGFYIMENKSPGGLSNVDLLTYFKQAEVQAGQWAERRGIDSASVIPVVVIEDHKSRKGPANAIVCIRAGQAFGADPSSPGALRR
ncbi:hypothetical protein ACI2L4_25245 [Streptomyces sparsogenes]|uniref:hypothetical protein n=1 Tax=Streptomyces sparsogenes TaxID=67365 RepID=UPI00384D3F4F